MTTQLPYIIETQICFAVLWLFYYTVLRHDSAFARNRLYLLTMGAAAFIFPLVSIPVYAAREAVTGYAALPGAGEALLIHAAPASMITWGDIIMWGYIAGIAIMSGIFAVNATRIGRIYKHSRELMRGKAAVFHSDRINSSFSLFNSIFINTAEMDEKSLDQVMLHEMAHIRLRHSLDLLPAQVLLILFWWNPFVWLWVRSLKEVHEFQADQAVLDNGCDSQYYISLLIRGIADIHPEFVSGFSYSLIKNRLKMMTKQNRKRLARFRIVLSLPILLGLMMLFSFTEKENGTLTDSGNSAATGELLADAGQEKDFISITDGVVTGKTSEDFSYSFYGTAAKDQAKTDNFESLTGKKVEDMMLIIDGEKATADDLKKLNPDRIENVTVLKDGSAKIYGDEAGNGVVLITTKPVLLAQNETIEKAETREVQIIRAETMPKKMETQEAPVTRPETMPKFEGGDIAKFQQWVTTQLKYPAEAKAKGIGGKVTIRFVVEKDGSIGETEIMNSPDPMLSEEVTRVVKSSPKWTPGWQGEAVRVSFIMPIEFSVR